MHSCEDAGPNATPARKFKVLIVDDSASVRQTLAAILSDDPALVVMGTASNPFAAAERIRAEVPDVIFLDIEMPRMDGLSFLHKIMAQKPIPVVICSSCVEGNSDMLMQALDAGAVEVMAKPRVGAAEFLQELRIRICDIAKAAAQAKLSRRPNAMRRLSVEAKLTADVMLPAVPRLRPAAGRRRGEPNVICIGASTGGTDAIPIILTSLPRMRCGIVVVQHMPEHFTAAFARRLDKLCELSVKEAEDQDVIGPGSVLIAPGNRHLMIERSGAQYKVAVKDGPAVCRHRPSVDVLFRSAALVARENAMGILLTGMGDDGARGLTEMRSVGAMTIAQDEESCVVFGMPKEAINRGAAAKILPLGRIAAEVVDQCEGAMAS